MCTTLDNFLLPSSARCCVLLGRLSVKITEDHGVRRNTCFGCCLNLNTNGATAHTGPHSFANSCDAGLGSAGSTGVSGSVCIHGPARAPRAGGAHVQKGGQGPQCNTSVSVAPEVLQETVCHHTQEPEG